MRTTAKYYSVRIALRSYAGYAASREQVDACAAVNRKRKEDAATLSKYRRANGIPIDFRTKKQAEESLESLRTVPGLETADLEVAEYVGFCF